MGDSRNRNRDLPRPAGRDPDDIDIATPRAREQAALLRRWKIGVVALIVVAIFVGSIVAWSHRKIRLARPPEILAAARAPEVVRPVAAFAWKPQDAPAVWKAVVDPPAAKVDLKFPVDGRRFDDATLAPLGLKDKPFAWEDAHLVPRTRLLSVNNRFFRDEPRALIDAVTGEIVGSYRANSAPMCWLPAQSVVAFRQDPLAAVRSDAHLFTWNWATGDLIAKTALAKPGIFEPTTLEFFDEHQPVLVGQELIDAD